MNIKTRLTKEQCSRLADFGLHSDRWTSFRNEQGFNETYEYFTFTDLLEILPKVIIYKDCRSWFTIMWNHRYRSWDVGYMYGVGFWKDLKFSSEDLIVAIYNLVCYYYGELKVKEK